MQREFEYQIMQEIKERWSPRAFSSERVSEEDLMAMLEAARYAPSCNNEQPWRFIIANDEVNRDKVFNALTESNKEWNKNVSSYIVLLSEKEFLRHHKFNEWNRFDAGTAWGFLALEAQRRGIISHGMAGFDAGKIRESFELDERYDIIAVIAVGKYGNATELPERFEKKEKPGIRRSIEELIIKV